MLYYFAASEQIFAIYRKLAKTSEIIKSLLYYFTASEQIFAIYRKLAKTSEVHTPQERVIRKKPRKLALLL